ncbi:basic secretory protein-like protein [Pseudochryseolinea flava]|uniref:Secretion system C-terminal sorting domain-containing protein n=1 Tax=Pseudochryseolinea flava TaxID=2059302 RepID=A0A364XV55_9BACT|nr:basic secretory protein-like protein [Pseudochryseolinea flava]RAV98220.1 hypothetical protein DQQ10_24780 [Pseudochryseolinea flava]
MKVKLTFMLCCCVLLSISFVSQAQVDITNSGGTISAQYTDSPTNEDITKLIDNNSSTKYLTFHNAGWVQFRAGSPSIVTSYAITSANDAAERDPLNWNFQASNNGTTWVTLDTRSNEDFPNRLQRKTYSFSNTTAYTYFKLNLTNNSGTILQVAEWEIYGTASPVATVYQHCSYGGYAVALTPGTYTLSALQARGMVNNDVSSVRVTAGYKIIFFDQDNFAGTSLEKTGDDDCLVNENFNDLTTSIRVEQVTGGGDWSNFVLPTVVFQDLSPSSAGSITFHRAIPDPVATMRNSILPMLQKIYSGPNDNVRTFTKLTLIIEDYDGVAEAWGGGGERSIRVSTRHIQNVYNQSNNDATVRTEILGILSHEATHTAQHEPKNAGGYQGGTEFFGFIEGVADYVRISLGLHPTRSPQTGGNWKDGYTTSGFFLNWIVNNKGDRDFAIKFNRAAGTYATWSWDIACRDILGIGVQTLWNEYQASLSASRIATSAPYAMGITADCRHDEEHIAPNEKQSIQVFPNPAKGKLEITLHHIEANDRTEVQFVSATFKKTTYITGANGTVNTDDLPAGIYVMIVRDKKGNSHKQRVIIEK